MPVTIQTNKVKFKDPNNQGFITFDAFASETSTLPTPPTTNGTYVLTVTVTVNGPTYSWVSTDN